MIGRSALVIDDSKSARFALRRCLEGHQYAVEAAESAEEAMRILAERKPGVIFLDHVMPDVDGFTVMRRLRANPDTAPIPVVMCSSSEGAEFDAQARAAGANAVLQKPPSPDRLRRILDDIEQDAARAAAALADPAPVAAPAPVLPAGAPPVAAAVPMATLAGRAADEALAAAMASRVAQVERELRAQIAELGQVVAQLAAARRSAEEVPPPAEEAPRQDLAPVLQALTERVETLERDLPARIAELRTQFDAALEAQAARTVERLAHAILGAIGRH